MPLQSFKDLVVVELASVLAGPSVGMFFAELGARVIKIENSAQGGDVKALVTAGQRADGKGLMINSSRGIIYAGDGYDFMHKARDAAIATRDLINQYRR